MSELTEWVRLDVDVWPPRKNGNINNKTSMSDLIEALLFTTVTTIFLQHRSNSTALWRNKFTHGPACLAAANRNVKRCITWLREFRIGVVIQRCIFIIVVMCGSFARVFNDVYSDFSHRLLCFLHRPLNPAAGWREPWRNVKRDLLGMDFPVLACWSILALSPIKGQSIILSFLPIIVMDIAILWMNPITFFSWKACNRFLIFLIMCCNCGQDWRLQLWVLNAAK